jgi:hypothetical protein
MVGLEQPLSNRQGALRLCCALLCSGCAGEVEVATAGAGGSPGTGGQTSCSGPDCQTALEAGPPNGSVGGNAATGGFAATGGLRAIVEACPGLPIASSAGIGGMCAGIGVEVDPSPVDYLFLLDRTASMTTMLQGSTLSRWDAVQQGLQKFIAYQLPDASRVGLVYFGFTDDSSDPAECDPSTYAQPTIPMAYPSKNGAAIAQSLADESKRLGGQTCTVPALQGALKYAQTWQAANPYNLTVVVLITGGVPAECDTDITHLAAVAADAARAQGAFLGGPAIRTFVIGVAMSQSQLDPVAVAGATLQATIIDGPTAPDQLASALSGLWSATSTAYAYCALSLPQPPAGIFIDPNKTQVIFKPYVGSNQEIPQVQSKDACSLSNGGWYYDSATNPQQIILCPCSCAATASGGLEVRFGCS